MPKPFAIWTLRRTGGTSLAMLLSRMAPFQQLEHEPFNEDRKFGWIRGRFVGDGDRGFVKQALSKEFADTPVLKHCYEIVEMEFNAVLAEFLAAAGYANILLLRRDEVSRMVSLFLAAQTNVWAKKQIRDIYASIERGTFALAPFDIAKMLRHCRHCLLATEELRGLLRKNGSGFYEVYYEDLFQGEKGSRVAKLEGLMEYLDITPDSENSWRYVEEMLLGNSQDSSRVLEFVPNYEEAHKALSQFTARIAS